MRPGSVSPADGSPRAPWVDASRRADVVGQRLGLARRRAHATSCAALGPAVTALVHRYNPVVVARQAATLEALEIVVRLLDGETVDFEGRFFRARGAVLRYQPQRRPPVYMSAFYEGAAEVAGRLADGIWTLGDPRRAPRVIDAYRRSCERHGREPGEVILQTLFSWADDDEAALEAAREWRGTLVDANYTDDVHDPAEIERLGEEEVSDRKLRAMTIVSSDPSSHVNRIKLLEGMGATIVALMNVSGADPHGALGVYGREVLPELRGRLGRRAVGRDEERQVERDEDEREREQRERRSARPVVHEDELEEGDRDRRGDERGARDGPHQEPSPAEGGCQAEEAREDDEHDGRGQRRVSGDVRRDDDHSRGGERERDERRAGRCAQEPQNVAILVITTRVAICMQPCTAVQMV